MNAVKFGEYIYPHSGFADLSNKKILDNFSQIPSKVGSERIENLLRLTSEVDVKPAGATVEEKILSIFLDPSIQLGDPNLVLQDKADWLKRISYYTSKQKPLHFCIMACPFKIPSPMKNERVYPDMGELILMFRLAEIMRRIEDVYPQGGVTHILAEGLFGRFTGVSDDEYHGYQKFLTQLCETFGLTKYVEVRNLDEIEAMPGFTAAWKNRAEEFALKLDAKDPGTLAEFNGAFDSVLRIVDTRGIPVNTLMDVYDFSIKDTDLSSFARGLREDIYSRATAATIQYRAFLKARDDVNYVEETIPGCLKLTVSAKRGNLPIHPVNPLCTVLPYHGVPVYYPEEDRFNIEYLIDIRRSTRSYEPVNYEHDMDSVPFFYSVIS